MVWMGASDISLLIWLVYTHYLYYCRPGSHMTVPRKITAHNRHSLLYSLSNTLAYRGPNHVVI